MIKVQKQNIVLAINETELDFYKKQGYVLAGEKETAEKTVSFSKYKGLEEELKVTDNALKEKATELENITSERDSLKEKVAELEAQLVKLNSKQKEHKDDKVQN